MLRWTLSSVVMDFFVLLSVLVGGSPISISVDWPFLRNLAFDKSSEFMEDPFESLEIHPHYGRIVGDVQVYRQSGNGTSHQPFLSYCYLEIVLVN